MSSSRTDPKGLHGAEIIHLLCCLDRSALPSFKSVFVDVCVDEYNQLF